MGDSRNEEILSAIINDGTYDGDAESRNEAILLSILNDTEYEEEPQSRMEDLLLQLKEKIEEGGGGGGNIKFRYNEFDHEIASKSTFEIKEE